MFIVYAIKSLSKNYIYVGFTSNLEKRLLYHNKGYEKTTKPYSPFKLIYTESFEDRISARKKGKYFKSGIGKQFLRSLINALPTGGRFTCLGEVRPLPKVDKFGTKA